MIATKPRGRLASLLLAFLLATAGLVAVGATPALAGTDDYPTSIGGCRSASNPSGGSFNCDLKDSAADSLIDPWNEYNRECTSFVAWRLHSRNSFEMPFNDNAQGWGPDASSLGYTVNMIPAVGAVAWWSSGHVAWVEAVSGSNVTIEEYNYNFTHNYSERTISVSSVSGYIHFHDSSPSGSGGGVQNMQILGTDNLTHGMRMYPNQYILSFDARWVLALQGDGNLVLYGPGYIPMWSSGTGGRSVDSLLVQDDGNVVIYGTGSQGAIWSTGTVGTNGVDFKVQEDGNVVVYDNNGAPHWSTGAKGTSTGGFYAGTDHLNVDQWLRPNQYLKSPDGRYVMYMQGDGNLVLWSPGARLQWTSGGGRTNVSGLLQQADGNLVVYASPIWASGATGVGPFMFKLQNDGNAVVYYSNTGVPLWATNTAGRI